MRKPWFKIGAVLICVSLAAFAQEASRGGVTVSSYVTNDDNGSALHVTVANDNDVVVKNVAYVLQWTCGTESGTISPGHRFDPVYVVAPGKTRDDEVNACTDKFVVQSIRIISFDK